jgi:hypothetical protein
MMSGGCSPNTVGTVGRGFKAERNPSFLLFSNARKITSSFCAEISFADKEEKPSLAGQTRLFLTQDAGERSSQKRNLFFERYLIHNITKNKPGRPGENSSASMGDVLFYRTIGHCPLACLVLVTREK